MAEDVGVNSVNARNQEVNINEIDEGPKINQGNLLYIKLIFDKEGSVLL